MNDLIRESKTQFIKARVTPAYKSAFIDKANAMNLEHTELILYALDKMDTEHELIKERNETIHFLQEAFRSHKTESDSTIHKLTEQVSALKQELGTIKNALDSIRQKMIKEPVTTIQGNTYHINTDVEIIQFLSNAFKFTPDEN